MSFVSIVATTGFVTVMSDGRVKDIVSGEIIQEDFQKFIKANDSKAFIAYAGNRESCEPIALNLKNAIEEGISFDIVQTILISAVRKLIPEHLTVMFALGGLNSDNEIEFYSFNSRENTNSHFKPANDVISYTFLNNTGIARKDFEGEFVKNLRETGFQSPTSTIQAQKLLNRYIASRDETVNNTTFRLSIKK